jgi:hypothetical protein
VRAVSVILGAEDVHFKRNRAAIAILDKMVLARNTGLRRANLFRAQWSWVDWLNRVVRVPRTKNNQAHAVPLNDTAHETLRRLYAERDIELDSAHVFVHARDARHAGKPVLDVKNAFHTALEEAGIHRGLHVARFPARLRVATGDGWRQSRFTIRPRTKLIAHHRIQKTQPLPNRQSVPTSIGFSDATRTASSSVARRVRGALPRRTEPPGLSNELVDRPPPPRACGTVRRRQRLGGLLSDYHRAA